MCEFCSDQAAQTGRTQGYLGWHRVVCCKGTLSCTFWRQLPGCKFCKQCTCLTEPDHIAHTYHCKCQTVSDDSSDYLAALHTRWKESQSWLPVGVGHWTEPQGFLNVQCHPLSRDQHYQKKGVMHNCAVWPAHLEAILALWWTPIMCIATHIQAEAVVYVCTQCTDFLCQPLVHGW